MAGANIARAGLSERVEQRVGPALEAMRQLIAEGAGPFDLIFIDADKPSTPDYFSLALELSPSGRRDHHRQRRARGGALDARRARTPASTACARLHELLAAEPRVSATTIQTVGSKGYDGFTLALIE